MFESKGILPLRMLWIALHFILPQSVSHAHLLGNASYFNYNDWKGKYYKSHGENA